jgi:hypothetical protein
MLMARQRQTPAEAEGLDEFQMRVLAEHVGWLEQLADTACLRGRPRLLPAWELGSWARAARDLLGEVQRLRAQTG